MLLHFEFVQFHNFYFCPSNYICYRESMYPQCGVFVFLFTTYSYPIFITGHSSRQLFFFFFYLFQDAHIADASCPNFADLSVFGVFDGHGLFRAHIHTHSLWVFISLYVNLFIVYRMRLILACIHHNCPSNFLTRPSTIYQAAKLSQRKANTSLSLS